MTHKPTVLLAVLLGCAAGYLGGRLAAPAGDGAASTSLAALQARIDDLEDAQRSPPVAREPALLGTQAARSKDGGGSGLEEELATLLSEPSPPLDALLAAAVKRGDEEAAAKQTEQTEPSEATAAQTKGKLAKIAKRVDGEIARWADKYDLADGQVAALKELASAALTRMVQAKTAGASPAELRTIDVGTQGQVRQIVGDDVYADTERARITRDARGGVAKLAGLVGLTKDQYAQVDRLIDQSVTRVLPDVMRVRSVALPPDEYDAVQKRLAEGRQADWQRIRDQILTEAQRQRIPEK